MTEENEASPELAPGSRFGSYEIVRLLGQGAFGAVYEALRMPLRKRTALKLLHREYVRQRTIVDRFVREAEVVAQLEHPHIVGVFDVGVEDGVPFIAMEFLDGESLASRIERGGAMGREVGANLMLALSSAVASVHDKGIIHRDLKPENVVLARLATGSEQPKLLDFGIAKVRDSSKALTRTSAVMGTPYYMSPEQAAESKHISPAADQWSLGVIAYEVFTGVKPFDGDSLLTLMNQICFGSAKPPIEVNADLPEELSAVIMRALRRDVADRFGSVREFGRALLPFVTASDRRHWESFFLAEAPALAVTGETGPARSGEGDLGMQGTMALAATPVQAAITRINGSPLPADRTLDPLTSSSAVSDARPRRNRRMVLAGAVLGVMLMVGSVIIALRLRPDGSAPAPAPPATATRAARTPAPPVAPAPTPAVAPPPSATVAETPGLVIANDAAVALTTADAAVGGRVAEEPEGTSRRHRRRNRRDEPRPERCPNGICLPI